MSYCNVTPLFYRLLSFQNIICNHFVSNCIRTFQIFGGRSFPISAGIFPLRSLPLSQPNRSTYKEHSRKDLQHNQDLSRKWWATPRFGNLLGLPSPYKSIICVLEGGWGLEGGRRRKLSKKCSFSLGKVHDNEIV